MNPNRNFQFIPVVSETGEPLMLCSPARARQLLRKKLALKRWNGGFFYIQLLQQNNESVQPIACGIDPGSKKEAIVIRSDKHLFLNLQLDAITHVKDKVKTRAMMRGTRRQRNTPYRKCRGNRSRRKGFVPPSTKARWDWKLKWTHVLSKLYPISIFVYEGVSAKTLKGKRRWNSSFSPLEVGKEYFKNNLEQIGPMIIKKGFEVKEKRVELGLKKSGAKLSDLFSAHCVDSWILSGFGLDSFDTTQIHEKLMFINQIRFSRRQLHKLQSNNHGKRPKTGKTVSLGFQRGSIVKHKILGLGRIGGLNSKNLNHVGLNTFQEYKAGPFVDTKDLQFLANCTWAWRFSEKQVKSNSVVPLRFEKA